MPIRFHLERPHLVWSHIRGEACCLGSDTPLVQAWGRSVPPKLGTPYWHQTVWHTATIFGTAKQVEYSMLVGESATLQVRGRKALGPPTCARTARETTTKFCMVIKLDVRKIFTASTTPPPLRWPKGWTIRMLDTAPAAHDYLNCLSDFRRDIVMWSCSYLAYAT